MDFHEALQELLKKHGWDLKTGISAEILTQNVVEHITSMGLLIQMRERKLGRPTVLSNAEALAKK